MGFRFEIDFEIDFEKQNLFCVWDWEWEWGRNYSVGYLTF